MNILKIVDAFLNGILRLHLSNHKILEISKFICFGIIGALNALIFYIVYVICISMEMNYLLASIFGFFISVFNAFWWNNKYTFRNQQSEKRSLWKTFVKTFVAYAGTGLVLNNILLVIWIDFLQIHELVAPILNLLITIPMNYLLNKFWAFKEIK